MAPTRSSFTGFCLLESSTWFPQALIRFMVGFSYFFPPAILLSKTTAHIYLCKFIPQLLRHFFQFYCRMFTGEKLALDPCSGHFRAELCNYRPIAPAASFFLLRHHLRPVFEIVSSGRWEL